MEEGKTKKRKSSFKKTILLALGSLGFLALGVCLGYFLAIYTDGSRDSLKEPETKEESNINSNVQEDKTLNSEKAFKEIKSKTDTTKFTLLSADILSKGDNDIYWVVYTGFNHDGYVEGAATFFTYKDGKWNFDYPGFTGTSEEETKKYNFQKIDEPAYIELTDTVAQQMIEAKRIEKKDNTWTATNVKVTMKGDDNHYMVSYTYKRNDGATLEPSIIFHYNENAGWEYDVPGNTGWGPELDNYHFKKIEQ